MIVRPDPLIFRAYDIRGLLGTEIDENVARDVGRSFASLRQAAVGRFARLLIGRDNRGVCGRTCYGFSLLYPHP